MAKIEQLMGAIVAVLFEISEGQKTRKDAFWGNALAAGDERDEQRLVAILRGAKKLLRRERSYLGEILPKWQEALNSASAFVKAESALGHKAQKFFNLEMRDRFSSMERRVKGFVDGGERVDDLVHDIEELAFDVTHLVPPGGWCQRCGDPLQALARERGWQECRRCYNAIDDESFDTEVTPPGQGAKRAKHAAARAQRKAAGGPIGGRGKKKKGKSK